MSFSFRLKSHPDKLLFEHLRNVGLLSKKIVESKCIKDKDVLSNIAYLIGISHDFAKATTFFQKLLDNREEQTEKARHSFLSSLFGYYLIKSHLLKINRYDDFLHLPLLAWIAIKRHHGNIQNVRWGMLNTEISALDQSKRENVQKQIEDIMENNLDEVRHIYKKLLRDSSFEIQEFVEKIKKWNEFTTEIKRDILKACRGTEIQHFFEIIFFYSVLLDADKLDASNTEMPSRVTIEKTIVDKYKKNKFGAYRSSINEIREKAYNEVNTSIDKLNLNNDRILAINLPTGIGKTLTAISFSLKLRDRIEKERSFVPKIIYCLPFLSIIDQNSQVILEILNNTGNHNHVPSNLFLKHHHLTDIRYSEEKDGELYPIMDVNKSLLLVEGWNSEIVITTFVQFFHSLVTNKNRAARKFHNIANSIIILDEVQSIPHKYWLLIKEALKRLIDQFNCWIILMTATQPLIFDNEKEIKYLTEDRQKYFQSFDRVKFNFDLNELGKFNETEFESFKEKILDEIVKDNDKNFMVVLNTIASCKELYEFLKEKICETEKMDRELEERLLDQDGICTFPNMNLVNLSTNILPYFRLKRINRIKDRSKRHVVITTQLIEAGVDISVDTIYRDLAPLDCIIQSAGRCNRNDEKQKGNIHIVLLKDKNGKKFCAYIYDSFLIGITQEVIRSFGKTVSEKDFVAKATDRYYNLIKTRGSKGESKNLLDALRKLNFSDTAEFQLIEKFPSASIFIEIDENAEKTRATIENVLSLKQRFERKEKLLELRKQINENTISVKYSKKTESISSLPPLEGEHFRYVPRTEIDKWYKLDTGFYFSAEDVNII